MYVGAVSARYIHERHEDNANRVAAQIQHLARQHQGGQGRLVQRASEFVQSHAAALPGGRNDHVNDIRDQGQRGPRRGRSTLDGVHTVDDNEGGGETVRDGRTRACHAQTGPRA